jgi:hypothetical protein
MVISNYSWEEQTHRLLSEAQIEKNDLDVKIKELKVKSDELDSEIEAFKIAIGAYLTRTGRQKSAQIDWVALLKPLSHKNKLVAIARENDGLVKQSQATDIIFNNSLSAARKRTTVYQIVKNSLDSLLEDGIIIRVRPGEYRLVGVQPKLT